MSQPESKPKVIIFTFIISIFSYYFLPDSFNETQRRMVCIFLVATIFWATEALPLFATSLLVVALEILFLSTSGGISHLLPAKNALPNQYNINYSVFIEPFGSSIIILFMGGFLLSKSLEKHKVDQYLANLILTHLAQNPVKLLAGILGASAFLSMWMSNTATATMMLAMLAPITSKISSNNPLRTALILAVPFGANIGGICTPIGTPPNAVAFEALKKSNLITDLSFFKWMVITTPIGLLLLTACFIILLKRFPNSQKLNLQFETPTKVKLNTKGKLALLIMGISIILWLTTSITKLNSATVALFAASALCAFRLLEKDDIDCINWNILILMWGGLSLGKGIELSGLTNWVASFPFDSIPGSEFTLIAIVSFIALFLSTFMSNTATANLLIPICLAIGTGYQSVILTISAGLSCSFAMAMPVSTPPNAIAYAQGKIKIKDMASIGIALGILGIIIMIPYFKFAPIL